MTARRLTLGVAVLAAALLSHPTAHACECMERPDTAGALAAASLVFEGEVLSVGPSPFAGQPCGGFCPDRQVRFRVARSWKGQPSRELTVYLPYCSPRFEVGTSYLVYVTGQNGSYLADLCTRTKPIAEAGEDLRVLGRGTRVR